jgi:sugar phosphate isomerase/epimerase
MKLAVSNIAWPKEQDAAVADVLKAHGVTGIEVAPTKVWPQPLDATDADIDDYRRSWNDRGFEVVAAQALLFGRPDLTLFDSAEVRAKTLDYLRGVVKGCARMGAKALVFGSPKNRRLGNGSPHQARKAAIAFFADLAAAAEEHGTCVVLEANPPQYGADFVTKAAEAIDFVAAVNRPGFRLHLDTACMYLARDPIKPTLETGFPLLRHFHVSDPDLEPPGTAGTIDHRIYAAELTARGYEHWVSLEMKEPKPFAPEALAASVRKLKEWYG